MKPKRQIVKGTVYDTGQSTLIADRLLPPSSPSSQPDYESSLWKTATGSYFMLHEKFPHLLLRLLGIGPGFYIAPLSVDEAYDILHDQQEIDALRREFPDRVHDA